MASLILHNLPEATIKQLEERAQHHSRSVGEEVMELLAIVKQVEAQNQPDRSSTLLGEALRHFIEREPDTEEPMLEELRDPSPGREDALWQD